CLQQMLQKANLPIEAGWHLRKMDWCYEAGDPLTEEVLTKNLAFLSMFHSCSSF
ncbi:hypothetical protein AB205_0201930, partial [Aquarana catesbeiana]